MDIAGAIPHPHHVSGLREIGGDRVVALDLPMVGVVAAKGALDGQAGRHHGPVDIERDALQLQPTHHLGNQFPVERMQSRAHLAGAATQPTTEGAVARQDRESAEPVDHRIPDQMTDMPQSARSDHQHRHDQADDRHRREVSGRIVAVQIAPQAPRELDAVQELAHQFQSRERRQSPTAEAKGKIPVDTGTQVSFSLSHGSWPFGWSEERLEHRLQTTSRGPIQAERRLDLAIGPPSVLYRL